MDSLPPYSPAVDTASNRVIRKPASPLGPLSTEHPATFGRLTNGELNRMKPKRILRIAWDANTWVPTAIYDASAKTKLFTVTMPAFTNVKAPHSWRNPNPGIHPNFYEYNQGKDDAPWTAAAPHLRLSGYASGGVSQSLEWEVACARLYKATWETNLYRPAASSSVVPIASTPETRIEEVPNVKCVFKPGRSEELSWRSLVSKGALYWRWPGGTASNHYTSFRVCFDVYERPVAAHLNNYPPGTAGKNSAQSKPTLFSLNDILAPKQIEKDGRSAEGSLSRFALYVDASGELLAEMLMGFIVLCAQSRRFDQIPSD